MAPFLTSLTAKASETISFMRLGLIVMGGFLILLLIGCIVITILTIRSKESSRGRAFILVAIYIAIAIVAVLTLLCARIYADTIQAAQIQNTQSVIQIPIEPEPEPEPEPDPEPEPEPEPEPQEFNIKLSFVGDCMLACYRDFTTEGSFNEYADDNEPSYFLEKVRHFFQSDDFTVVNLENVLTDRNLYEKDKDHDPAYWFKSKTANIEILTIAGVEGVSLANNHIYDYGEAGYNDTVDTVTEAGLAYGTDEKIMYFEKEGFKIAVICHGLWYDGQTFEIIPLLEEAKQQSDYQIVFYHGGQEGVHSPEDWKIRESRKLVDNGADLVIGNHPHVLQPREIYNGVEIIYSLGNFCYGGHQRPENRTIIYQMDLVIDKETLAVKTSQSTITPCYVYTAEQNNYQPAVIENEDEAQKVLDFMDGYIDSPI